MFKFSDSPHLDRNTKKFIDYIEAQDSKPLYELTPEQAREFLSTLQRNDYIEIEAEIIDTFINTDTSGEVDVRFIRPKNSTNEILPLILYLHGGGWIMGDKDTHDMLVRHLSVCTNSVVAFVNYSRSPEAVYPTAIEEIYGVLQYLYDNAKDFNINPDKIVIAGDSAGANMAAVTCIKSKIEHGPKILYQVLLYPVTDAKMNTESYDEFKNGPWLSKKAMEWFWDAYVPEKEMRKDYSVSPINADIADLEELPPALIITAENDVLRDEGEAYARKLDSAGVEVSCVRINNTHHDFLMLNALASTLPAKTALNIICSYISSQINK